MTGVLKAVLVLLVIYNLNDFSHIFCQFGLEPKDGRVSYRIIQ